MSTWSTRPQNTVKFDQMSLALQRMDVAIRVAERVYR